MLLRQRGVHVRPSYLCPCKEADDRGIRDEGDGDRNVATVYVDCLVHDTRLELLHLADGSERRAWGKRVRGEVDRRDSWVGWLLTDEVVCRRVGLWQREFEAAPGGVAIIILLSSKKGTERFKAVSRPPNLRWKSKKRTLNPT